MTNAPIEKIKERLSISDVISSYLQIDPAGSNFKAKCPFHNEKTPSFFISPARGTYYCFGCGAKGDMINFVQEFEGLDFMGALKILASRAGVELTYESKEIKDERERLYKIMEDATAFYQKNLTLYPEVRNYLEARGITEETMKEFQIGYVPNEWRLLSDYLRQKGYTEIEIEKAGLGKKSDKVNERGQATFYDRFRSRIMFPIADSSGRPIAFSGRIFPEDKDSAKYLNSPDTVLYNKSNVLYGIDKAKGEIRRQNYTVMVEGQMDLIMSHQIGCKNTVAVSGTGLSENIASKEHVVNNLGIVKRLSNNIMLAFDSDKAGLAASARATYIAIGLGMDVKIVKIPGEKDPADYIKANGDGWKELLRNAKPAIEFYLHQILETEQDRHKLMKSVKETVLPFVVALEGNMEKAHFVKVIASALQIAEDVVWGDVRSIEQENSYKPQNVLEEVKNSPQFNRKDYVERKIMGILLWQDGKSDPQVKRKDVEERIISIGGAEYLQKLTDWAESIAKELAFEAEVFYESSPSIHQDLGELYLNLEEDCLKLKLEESMELLSRVEKEGNMEQITPALQACQDISKKIQDVKNRRFT